MASHHPANDLDSIHSDYAASTPRSDHFHDEITTRLRFMCSFGGKILPRPHDNQLRYVGGDTRIVAVQRHTSYSTLLSKLSKLCGKTNISIKYQLPNEDLDSLITISADEDIENMMEEYDRLSHGQKSARLRLFLFPIDNSDSRATSISSLLDGSAKRESWFVDALNGGQGSGPVLERGRSEVSSIVSEVPDYLFGFDNCDEKDSSKIKNKNPLNDNVSMSDPGSPAPVVSSPFCSTSSSLVPPVIPDLPPVKTKLPVPIQQVVENKETEIVTEKLVQQQTGYQGGAPMWHYPNPSMQPVPALYYMPAGTQVQPGNIAVPNIPVGAQFVQQYQVAQGQLPVGFPGMGQVYGAGVRPYGMYADNSNQPMYYGARNITVVPGSYPGMMVQGGEELQGVGADMISGRVSQGS